jgi:iron complex outermembrane receptor protein
MRSILLKVSLLLSISAIISSQTIGAGLGQQITEEVIVVGQKYGSLSAVSSQQAREKLTKIPGAIGFVESKDFLDNFAQSIGDTLIFTPGVFADTSAQRENRISIRGSGLNAGFERRGLTVLRDGVPISRASGITEFQEIDTLSIQYIEVYKGANGLQYGAASLGGAINVVTPTGVTQPEGTALRVEGGSFGTTRASINTAGKSDNIDYYGAVTKLDSDGYRDQSEVDSIYSFANVGIALSDKVETRFYLTALQDDFKLAGSLSKDDALNDPTTAGFENEEYDQDRNLEVYRLSNRTVIAFDNATLEASSWVTQRKLDHAITRFVGIIDQDETEYGLSAQLSGNLELDASAVNWIAGFNYARANNEAKVFDNNFGSNGPLNSEDDQDSENLVVYGQGTIEFNTQLSLILGAQYVDTSRDNQNIFTQASFPGAPIEDDSGELDFDNINGRIGLLWTPNNNVQHFVNISEGYEPPGISDITSGGSAPFTELNAQESITYEIGTRGHKGIISWDGAIYRSEIREEFIDVAAPGRAPGTTLTNTDNAEGDTIHQGIELGVDVRLLDGATDGGWQLMLRNVVTYNDFRFDNDSTYGNNTLAGVPELIYVAELRLDHADNWYAGINLRHVANGAYVDYANTERAPGYHVVGLTAGWQISTALRLFASVENITDEEYISNVSTVANFQTESSQTLFTPGEGRAAYIGMSYQFE